MMLILNAMVVTYAGRVTSVGISDKKSISNDNWVIQGLTLIPHLGSVMGKITRHIQISRSYGLHFLLMTLFWLIRLEY